MRHLASVQKILEIVPIEGADKIELATVLGWKCVIGKGEFKVGDLVVYCEVDSVLPEWVEFEFLRKGNFIDNGVVKGFRIKTRKFKGQYSQGIIFPLSILDGKKYQRDIRDNPKYDFKEGKDVSDLLQVQKYEKPIPICLQGKIKGLFPSFIPKTDETRVQVLQPLLTKYKGTKCYITEKVDGTSCTMYFNNGIFGVCSRNLELKPNDISYHENVRWLERSDGKFQKIGDNGEEVGEPLDEPPKPNLVNENVYWKVAIENNLESKLSKLGMNIAIQGEIFGDGLQGNPLKVNFVRYVLFSVFDIDKQEYYDAEGLCDMARELGLETVPILNPMYELSDNIPELVELSKGNSVYNAERKREGIVIRPIEYLADNTFREDCVFGRISFKVINPAYLVDNDE